MQNTFNRCEYCLGGVYGVILDLVKWKSFQLIFNYSIQNVWKITDKENNGTLSDFIITKQNEQSIEIDPGTFKHGKAYDVSLTASYPEGTQSSEASYSINVAVVPEPGMCTVVYVLFTFFIPI